MGPKVPSSYPIGYRLRAHRYHRGTIGTTQDARLDGPEGTILLSETRMGPSVPSGPPIRADRLWEDPYGIRLQAILVRSGSLGSYPAQNVRPYGRVVSDKDP
jgi:hypothetical protein